MAVILAIVFSASPVYSQILDQREKGMLLQSAQLVHGIVVDPNGNPIARAHIDYSVHYDEARGAWWGNLWDRPYVTDAQGQFSLETRAPALVIRKPGFHSKRLIVAKSDGPLRITLEPNTNLLRPCPERNHCDSDPIRDWGGVFCLKTNKRVQAGRPGHDIDYGRRNFIIQTSSGPKVMSYGAGPMWSYGMPNTKTVWSSEEYEETVYETGDFEVVDAHERMPSGKLWRYFGRVGESVDYEGLDSSEAQLFDQVIDDICIRKEK